MKKVFFVCTLAVLLCSACKWFGNKPDINNTTVVTDSTMTVPDTTLSENPDTSVKATQTASTEKEVTTTTKPSGR